MLGFILGPMLEENFRRAMLLSRGDFNIFVTRPISATLLSVISIVVIWQTTAFFRAARKNRNKPALVAEEVAPAAG